MRVRSDCVNPRSHDKCPPERGRGNSDVCFRRRSSHVTRDAGLPAGRILLREVGRGGSGVPQSIEWEQGLLTPWFQSSAFQNGREETSVDLNH